MQILLKCKTTKNEIPLEYRKAIMSLLKNSIKEKSPILYSKYYDNTKKKDFTFSLYAKNICFKNDKFEIDDNQVYIQISTSDTTFGYLLLNVLLNQLHKPYPLENNNYLILLSVRQKQDKKITRDTIVCKTLSPICICEHKKGDNSSTKFYSIDSPEFIQSIKEKYNVEFQPLDCKKRIVRHQKMKFETTSGIFVLIGKQHNLEKLYLNGLGCRTGEGFGKFDIIG